MIEPSCPLLHSLSGEILPRLNPPSWLPAVNTNWLGEKSRFIKDFGSTDVLYTGFPLLGKISLIHPTHAAPFWWCYLLSSAHLSISVCTSITNYTWVKYHNNNLLTLEPQLEGKERSNMRLPFSKRVLGQNTAKKTGIFWDILSYHRKKQKLG